jgi:hypothetical protein
MQLIAKHAPFVISIHYMAHRCNMVMQTISSLPLVAKSEALLQSMYVHFSHFPRRHVGHGKLVKKISNKRFENPSQFQNLVDIHAWTCHTCFGLV